MGAIDISNINNAYNKTMLFYLIEMLENYKMSNENIEQFIRSDIIDNNLFEQLGNDLNALTDVEKLIDGENIYHIEKMNYSNNAVNVLLIDEIDEIINNINYEINQFNIIENTKLLIKINSLVVQLNTSISSSAIRFAQENEEFNINLKYMPSPLLIGHMHTIKDFWLMFIDGLINFESQEATKLLELKLKSDVDFIKSKINYLEFMLSIRCILDSPFYDSEQKSVLNIIYKELQELMYNCNIGRFFIEHGYASEIAYENRGASDRTTRIQILFILDNMRPFSLRIDLAHKGVSNIHINLEDIKGDEALPIDISCFKEISKQIDNKAKLEKLFYKSDNKYWFVSSFEKAVNESRFSDREKTILLELFRQRGHFSILEASKEEEKIILKCVEMLRPYLIRNIHIRHEPLNNTKLNHRVMLKNIMLKLDYNLACLLLSVPKFKNGDTINANDRLDSIKDEFLRLLYEYYEYDTFPANELNELDMLSILGIIDEELYCKMT